MLLGLDLGTTNVKALVTDQRGKVLGRGSRPIQLFTVGEGGVEQDLEEIWSAAQVAMRQSLSGVAPNQIEAIGLSSQGGALQVLTAAGAPRGRVVSWLDQRGRSAGAALTNALGRAWFRPRIGHGRCSLAGGQLLRLRHESPHWIAAPNRIGFVGDLIVERLCGRAAHDATSSGLTLLFNPRLRDYDPELLDQLGVARTQLPEILSPRQAAGGLRADVAHALGLPPGIPVSPAVHDQYAAALGTGAVRPGVVMVGAGTAWVLLATSQTMPPLVVDDAFVCTHVVDGLHGQIVSMTNGGSALNWVLNLLGRAPSPPEAVDALLASVPPGCAGLGFWPFMTPFGGTGLAPATRGRLSGIQLSHGVGHVARAVVEGLVFELKRHLDFLACAGMPVEQLVLGGAVAASAVTPQIMADVTGLPLACLAGGEGSLLGAAVLARGLLEPDRSLAALSAEMLPPARQLNPGEHAAFYQARAAEYRQSLPCVEGEPAARPHPPR